MGTRKKKQSINKRNPITKITGKRPTANQASYYAEIKKLRARIKRLEKKGFTVAIPTELKTDIPLTKTGKPKRITKKDIERVSNIRGATLKAYAQAPIAIKKGPPQIPDATYYTAYKEIAQHIDRLNGDNMRENLFVSNFRAAVDSVGMEEVIDYLARNLAAVQDAVQQIDSNLYTNEDGSVEIGYNEYPNLERITRTLACGLPYPAKFQMYRRDKYSAPSRW